MRQKLLASRTLLILISAVAAVLLVVQGLEEWVTALLLGAPSAQHPIEKWVDLGVTGLAILAVGGGAALIFSRANRAREIVWSQGQIIGHMAEAVITIDLAGRIEYWNKGAERLFGFSAAEAIGTHVAKFTGHSPAEMKVKFEEPIKARGHYDFSDTMTRKSGDTFVGDVRASVVNDAQGSFVGIVAYVLDVTERKESEEALRRSEHFLAEAQRISHLGTWNWEPDSGVLTWSDEVYRIFGAEPQAFPGSYAKFMEYVREDDKTAVRDFLRSAPSQKHRTSVDYQIKRQSDGAVRYIQGQAEPFYDGNGDYVGITGTVMDITDRMRSQELLQQAHDDLERRVEERTHELRTTLETMVEGMITIDHTGTVESFNTAAENIFGYSSGEMIGQNVSKLMEAGDASAHDGYLEAYLETGAAKIIGIGRDVRGRRKDGSTFPLSLGIGEMLVGGARKFVGTVQDITEQKEAERVTIAAKEEAEAANKAKSEFLASMSHELRTPMNAVLGFSQLLEADNKTPLVEHQKVYVDEILRSGRHMVELIDRVLDLESVESGKVVLNMVSAEAEPLVEQCLSLIETEARSKGITIVNRPPCGSLPTVMTDQLRFRQAVLNLISNAIKYNSKNGTVTIGCETRGRDNLRVSVSDTGIGIAEDDRHKVFEPFERLGAENSNILGAGIGLSVTKQFVESMGGTIGFESTPGSGTTFWIDFPLAEPAAADEV
jgi:PAS domain S-box-containing protein